MRSDTRTFIAANKAKSKDTRFVIVQSFDNANTILRAFTSHADAALPSGVTAYTGVVQSFSSTSQSLDPITGNSTIGDISWEVVDYTSQITTELGTQLNTNNRSVRKKRTQVYVGYKGLVWADYTLLTTQFVDKSVDFESGIYKFNCSDIQREMRTKIMKPKETTIGAAFSKTDVTLTVVATAAFVMMEHDAGYSDAPSATVGYVKISKNKDEFEILRYTGKTATTFTGITRARFGTREIELTYDGTVAADRRPKVEEIIYLEGPVPKLIYAVRTGVLYNQGAAVLPAHWHQGISTAYVRLSDFTSFGADWWDTTDPNKGFQFYQVGLKETDGKSFVEKQLQLMMGAFGPIYADGSVGLKRMAAVLSSSGYVAQLNASNLVSYGGLTHDYQKVHNVIEVLWNYDYVAQKHTRVNLFVDTDSQVPYGGVNADEKYTLKFDGLSGDVSTLAMLTNQFAAIRDRYAGPPLYITVNVLPSLNAFEVGDTVRLTLDQVRDYTKPTGTTGAIDRVFEIQNITVNWFTGDLQLKLFGSSKLAKWVPLSATTGAALPNAEYAIGTDLVPVLSISGGIAASGTITGAATMAAARYRYNLGDLTIPDGVTVTATQNSILYVMGHLTIAGTLTTTGQGLAGAAVPALARTSPSTYFNLGTAGDLGNTHAAGTIYPRESGSGVWQLSPGVAQEYFDPNIGDTGQWITYYLGGTEGAITQGKNIGVTSPNIIWDGTNLQGLPTSLRGTSGGSGGPVISAHKALPGTAEVTGGAGGAGSGGLIIVCRGLTFSGSGRIITSGGDGSSGVTLGENGATFVGGGGAGGAAGGCIIIADGDLTSFAYPTSGQFVAQQGLTPVGGAFAPDYEFSGGPYATPIIGTTDYSSLGTVTGYRASVDASGFGGGNYRMVRLNPSLTAVADVPLIAAPPTAVSAVEAANTPQTPAENLATVTLTTTPPADTNRIYDQTYYRVTGTAPWTPLGPANNVRTFVAAMDGTSYEIEARSISQAGKESPTGARTTIVMSNAKGGVSLSAGNYIGINKTSYADTTDGIFLEKSSGGVARAYFGDAVSWLKWTSGLLDIKGTITATLGTIGGWILGTTELKSGSGANTVGLDSGGTNPAIYAGSATPGIAPFRVTQAGALTATNATITGAITATSGTFTGVVQAVSGGFGTGYTPVTITTTGLTLTGAAGITITGSGSIKVSSGANYIEYSATSIKGYSNSLGYTTFELKADGSPPVFSGGVVSTTIFNVSSAGIIRTSATVGDGSASGYGVIMNDTGLKGYKASSATPTFILNAANGDASFGQTTTTKYIKFTASSGEVELGRDTKFLGTDSYNNDAIYYSWGGDSVDGFSSATAAGGAVSASFGALLLTTTTTSGSDASTSRYLYTTTASSPSWSKNRRAKFLLRFEATPGTNQVWDFGTGFIGSSPNNCLCFRLKASSLAIYAESYNSAGANTELNLATNLSAATDTILEIVFLTGTSAEYFVNGVSKGSITTNLPTGTVGAPNIVYFEGKCTGVSSTSSTCNIGSIKFLQDP